MNRSEEDEYDFQPTSLADRDPTLIQELKVNAVVILSCAAIGAAIGYQLGEVWKGALIGAAVPVALAFIMATILKVLL